MLLHVNRDRNDYLGRGAHDGHLDYHTAPALLYIYFGQCCFTSTETTGTVRDVEPRKATSTFTQLLSSELEFSVALRPQRPQALLRIGSPGRPPRLSHSSWALRWLVQCCFTSTKIRSSVRDREPRTVTSTFTQLLSFVQLLRSVLLYVHRDHKHFMDGEPGTATSISHTAPELWGQQFCSLVLNVLGCRMTYQGQVMGNSHPERLVYSHSSFMPTSRQRRKRQAWHFRRIHMSISHLPTSLHEYFAFLVMLRLKKPVKPRQSNMCYLSASSTVIDTTRQLCFSISASSNVIDTTRQLCFSILVLTNPPSPNHHHPRK